MKEQMIQPSRLDQVKNELAKAINQGLKVPEEIKEAESKLFHVLLIKSTMVSPVEIKFESRVQCYHKRSWNSVKKNINNQGYNVVCVLHDPELIETTETQGGEPAGDDTELTFHELKSKAKEAGMEVSPKTTKEDIDAFFEEKD